jgi:hypothetical protein
LPAILMPMGEGMTLRRRADQRLLRGLIVVAADSAVPLSVRRKAAWGARLFASHWIRPGHSGRRPPPDLAFPIYGRWCGPAHGGGCPIDEIDALCRAHDLEYERAEISDLLQAA